MEMACNLLSCQQQMGQHDFTGFRTGNEHLMSIPEQRNVPYHYSRTFSSWPGLLVSLQSQVACCQSSNSLSLVNVPFPCRVARHGEKEMNQDNAVLAHCKHCFFVKMELFTVSVWEMKTFLLIIQWLIPLGHNHSFSRAETLNSSAVSQVEERTLSSFWERTLRLPTDYEKWVLLFTVG